MGKHETITAEISEAMASSIREAVESGDFSSPGEVVRHALAEWRIAQGMPKIQPNQLDAMLDRGLEGPGVPAEDVFSRLEARYAALAAAQEHDG
mgnify:CR=1 FL=1